MVPGNELPAQRQEEVDEERERANAALLLDEEIDKRVMDAVYRNEEAFARYIAFIFGRHLMHDPTFVDAVQAVIQRREAKKE